MANSTKTAAGSRKRRAPPAKRRAATQRPAKRESRRQSLRNRLEGAAASRFSRALLALVAYTESFVFLIPPDILLIPMAIANPRKWIRFAGIATAASVAGALTGYAIGALAYQSVGEPLLEYFGFAEHFEGIRIGCQPIRRVGSDHRRNHPVSVQGCHDPVRGSRAEPRHLSRMLRGRTRFSLRGRGLVCPEGRPRSRSDDRETSRMAGGYVHSRSRLHHPCSGAASMNENLTRLLSPQTAFAAAVATLAGAFASQHLGGLEPCPLCIWQRWPYAAGAALVAAGIGFRKSRAAPFLLGTATLVFFGGAALSAWHAGIEYGFWPGPASCGAGMDLENLSGESLLEALEAKPLVRCDSPQWTLGGISLAGWSSLIQLAIAGILAVALRRSGRRGLLARIP